MINKINTSKIKMSKRHSKRPKIDQQSLSTEAVNPLQRLPNKCKDSVRNHINSVYVGSIVRIYDTAYGSEGHLVTAHWITENGLFATVHEDCKMDFVSLKYKTWVVDQRQIKPGSFRLFARFGTDDIEEEDKVNTINEVKQKNSRVLMNNTLMDYPTQRDRQTYRCCLFRLTCNCGLSKKVKKYICSEKNEKNKGKYYYACNNRYGKSSESCNFFVWEHEIDHESYVTCKCGVLCKKINISADGLLPIYKFVCINRGNKYHKGCNCYSDGN